MVLVLALALGCGPQTPVVSVTVALANSSFARQITARTQLPDSSQRPWRVAVGDGQVWVLTRSRTLPGPGGAVRIDGSGAIAQSLAFAFDPEDFAVGFGSLWVGKELGQDGRLVRVDARSGDVLAEVAAERPLGPAVTVGFGAVWTADYFGVGNREGATVTKIDPSTNRVSGVFPVGSAPLVIRAEQPLVWTSDHGGSVTALDPSSGRTVFSVPLALGPHNIVRAGAWMWIAAYHDSLLRRIDATTGRLESAAWRLPFPPLLMLAVGDELWVASAGEGTLASATTQLRRLRATDVTNLESITLESTLVGLARLNATIVLAGRDPDQILLLETPPRP